MIVFSQNTGFEEGVYISIQGDTVKTFLYQDSDDKMLDKIFCSTSKDNGERKALNPYEVKRVIFRNGTIYESVDVKTSSKNSGSTSFKFCKAMVLGYCSMYKYNSSGLKKDLKLIIEKECKYYTLVQQSFVDQYDRIQEDLRYQNVLRFLFSDCESVSKTCSGIIFNETSIAAVVKKYNMCKGFNPTTLSCGINDTTYKPIKRKSGKLLMYGTAARVFEKGFPTNFALGYGFKYLYRNKDFSTRNDFVFGLKHLVSQYYSSLDIEFGACPHFTNKKTDLGAMLMVSVYLGDYHGFNFNFGLYGTFNRLFLCTLYQFHPGFQTVSLQLGFQLNKNKE